MRVTTAHTSCRFPVNLAAAEHVPGTNRCASRTTSDRRVRGPTPRRSPALTPGCVAEPRTAADASEPKARTKTHRDAAAVFPHGHPRDARTPARARHHRPGVDRPRARLPQHHRQDRAAHRRAGGRARQADRGRPLRRPSPQGEDRPLPGQEAGLQGARDRRQGRQGPPAGGQPAPGRLRGQALHRARHDVPGPHPGGERRPDPRGREVRLHQGLQVLDLRHLVDPAGDHPRHGRLRSHHPAARPPGRAGQQGGPHPAPHAPGAGARAHRRGARPRARHPRGPDHRAARVQPRPGQPGPDRRHRRGVAAR